MNADHKNQDLQLNKDRAKRDAEKDFSAKLWKANPNQDEAREDSAKVRGSDPETAPGESGQEVQGGEGAGREARAHAREVQRPHSPASPHKEDNEERRRREGSFCSAQMISAEAPVLFSKACELFIKDITYRALYYTNYNKRKTLQRSDIAATVNDDEMFDFLIDIIPRDESTKDYQSRRAADELLPPPVSRNAPKPVYSNPRNHYNEHQSFMKNPLSSSHINMAGPLIQPPRPIANNSNYYGQASQVDPSDFGADDFMSERSHFGVKSKK